MTTAAPLPTPQPSPEPPVDYIGLEQELNSLRRKPDLQPDEIRRVIAICRALRKTNTGPKKATRSGTKGKAVVQKVGVDELFDL